MLKLSGGVCVLRVQGPEFSSQQHVQSKVGLVWKRNTILSQLGKERRCGHTDLAYWNRPPES